MPHSLSLIPGIFALLLGAGACTQPLVVDHTPPVAAPAALAPTSPATPPVPATASGCDHPFGLYDNAELVYDVTDAAGKRRSQLIQRVVRLEANNGKHGLPTTGVLLKSGLYDPKNKLLNIEDLTVSCRRDTAFSDGTAQLPPDALSRFRDRKFIYSPTNLAWPNQPTVGTTLPAGGISVEVRSSAVHIADVYVRLKNRRVVSGPELVATPAGSFACYKVEAERESGTKARADVNLGKVGREVTYYSPAVGIVKTEQYAKGKLTQVLVLVKRTNPTGVAGK